MNLPTWLLYILILAVVSGPFYLSLRNIKKNKHEQLESTVRRLIWIPGIVAFGFRAYTNKGFDDVGFGLGQLPWLFLVAWLAPMLMEFLLIFFAARVGLARLDPTLLQFQKGKVYINEALQLLIGNETQSYLKFTFNLLLTLTVGAVMTLFFAFAEEFGWRGFLQAPLIQNFGLGSGLMLGGLIWGFWYAPMILIGYRFPEHPRAGAFIYWPIYTICLAIITGWLYWQSGSIWVAALFNASTKVSGRVTSFALGDAGDSHRVRVVWLWLWGSLAVFFLALWQVGGFQ
ncbi:MAG TPA: CPBP family intramembrane glutamic endopeptidase [Anaerolineales bacterium]|nr:CPBP family intramembrane glutamic endopeptidase [Anaerolineales bacterium]